MTLLSQRTRPTLDVYWEAELRGMQESDDTLTNRVLHLSIASTICVLKILAPQQESINCSIDFGGQGLRQGTIREHSKPPTSQKVR